MQTGLQTFVIYYCLYVDKRVCAVFLLVNVVFLLVYQQMYT